ncbi:ABC transporter substrate-binding protein [Anaerocolumna cellulosilytica]|uniref:ABC transporter substrate-binding protein n=1 Tax=Anaerocolumna cellulosilytica TaxID=433286 RepID=A0A6S6R398_9FIRM|nr:extracellular solute-binding protein [Anaerocolumna cellulosilytica]MBB5194250.1 ABC-type glycerol-3-phosphate transport system substrate-binding protein/surface antigen [Anaerocolumna cellulosilytica]BCJ94537.1 ABC transporter substrate-binding protein [Anaerocolumna cellulosilytica]
MKRTKEPKMFVILLLIFATLSNTFHNPSNIIHAETNRDISNFIEQLDNVSTQGMGYQEYISRYDNTKKPNAVYTIEAKDYVRVEGMTVEEWTDYEKMEGISVYTEESGFIEYEVMIETEGFYELAMLYYPVEGKSASIQRGIFIDGEFPYKELNLVEFSRIWVDSVDQWEKDNRGNDLKPTQREAPEWITSYCYDSNGYETNRLSVYLTVGKHTITLYSRREPMLLRKIILSNSQKLKTYSQLMVTNEAFNKNNSIGKTVRIEAEDANRKSSQMLYPTQDKSSPAVFPYNAKELRNNTVGNNSNWRLLGQWLEWDFEIEESGYYYITLHAKQNFVRGIYTSRKISIDGKVPFEEMNDYGFYYHSDWNMITLGSKEKEPYLFYLEAGKHTLRMEVVLGDFSKLVSRVQDCILKLNSIYRKVIRITGVEPDKYRDYNIETNVPGLQEETAVLRDQLDEVLTGLKEVSGGTSNREAVLKTMRDQLDYISKDVERFTKVLGSYKINMSAMGTWISSALEQPLALDTIYVHSPDVKIRETNNSFWDKLRHSAKTLLYSFIIDYNSIGTVVDEDDTLKTITVWVGSGRDQANVLKSLIDESFTAAADINVNVMLVDMSTLLQATLSGQGPDVALQVGGDLPMNYGLRNAVVDLSAFNDLGEIKERFRESAMVPFQFERKTYALPETQTYLMMFYRKDILKELGLAIPTTWDDMKIALSVLSKNQMDLGMLPLTEQVFAMLLYQGGGEYYNSLGTASALDSDISINTFKEYCAFYTDYKLDKETSVSQRFRTGEAPLVISDFTLYNELQVSAPDLKGLWGFTMVPGTFNTAGNQKTVDHTVTGTGTAAVIMSASKEKEASWEFLKWWTSTEIQTQYGREMEALLGAAARYPTANIEAFRNLPWPSQDYEALMKQAEWLAGIPQVPGGYYSWRNINNAFYHVVSAEEKNKMQPREALTDFVRYINDEITFKRKEFGLITAE